MTTTASLPAMTIDSQTARYAEAEKTFRLRLAQRILQGLPADAGPYDELTGTVADRCGWGHAPARMARRLCAKASKMGLLGRQGLARSVELGEAKFRFSESR